MHTPLHAWKETLEDLGVMGIVPESQPQALPSVPVALNVPLPMPKMPKTTDRTVSQYRPATRAAETSVWEAPDDPVKNPPARSVEECGSLEALNTSICNCEACPLGAGRIKFVFGEGSPTARMMFVGEGPGRDEDIQGRPFVGRAGALLDKMIASIGMRRDEVYIANVVKCRPPDNRTPTPMESRTCLRYLIKQIELIRPAVLVGLGATPLRDIMGIASGITKIRGSWHIANVGGRDIPFMPTFHPAYVLRQYTKEVRKAVWEDLLAAQKKAESE
jgi:DNA polymerase